MRRALVIAALAFSPQAAADGKIYASDLVPEIPDQRALIAHDGRQQILLLQSRFAAPEGRRVGAVGWVVPAPSVPELATMPAGGADRVFRRLARSTAPEELSLLPLVALLALSTLAFALVMRLLGRREATRQRRWAHAWLDNVRFATLRQAAIVGLIGCLLAAVALPSYQGVEILKQLQVGPYAANVVRARSPAELVAWLKQEGFAYGEADAAALAGYIGRGWVFVTARIAPDKDADFGRGGMSPPLLLRFASPQPVYPLALTATAGRATEVSLYVFAPAQADAGGRLPLVYAGPQALGSFLPVDAVTQPNFFRGFGVESAGHLSKFKGRLEPAQMREDLVLRPASAPADFRESAIGPLSKAYGGASLAVAALAAAAWLSRRASFRRLNPVYYLLISLFLTPIAGLAFLLAHAIQDLRAAR